MISAKIITDSINHSGSRITTFVCTYPRWILAEVNTHRALSRNSASSRAIPTHKMISNVWHNPAMPVTWGKNNKGMQSNSELNKYRQFWANLVWLVASKIACIICWILSKIGVHKQLANRVLEPFSHMTTIFTATEWGNFFNLRCHKDAQPEFRALAYAMLEAYMNSTPKELKPGEWHAPFADQYLSESLTDKERLKIATARCARVSYLNFEGNIDHAKDYKLHDDLLKSGHCSPFEHCAQSWTQELYGLYQGNFTGGWLQYRKTLPNENRKQFDPEQLMREK